MVTPQERVLAELLALAANTIHPTPAAFAQTCARIRQQNGAPGVEPGTPIHPSDGYREPTNMSSIPRPAHELRPGDIITVHPDHPDRAIRYRVTAWARRIDDASVLVDYTTPPAMTSGHVTGPTSGVLVLDRDQSCQVEQAGDGPAYPEPGSEIPGLPGFVVGTCEHRVAASEWRAGFRTCERCPAEPVGGAA